MGVLNNIGQAVRRYLTASGDGTETDINAENLDGSGVPLVPASITTAQLIDYANATGDDWAYQFYTAGLSYGYGRTVAVSFATLNRCITLLSSMMAGLITREKLWVADRDGSRVTAPRIRAIMDVLRHSPDGNVTSGFGFIEDLCSDYLLDGNGLLLPRYATATGRRLTGLTRFDPWSSTMQSNTESGVPVYQLFPIRGVADPTPRWESARDVIHVRWPQVTRRSQNRTGFAQPPVVALRPALEIGLRGDRYIRSWFARGAHPKLHIDVPRIQDEPPLPQDAKDDIVEYIRQGVTTRRPLITFGATSRSLNDTPQDREAGELREFQVQEVARFYGLPPPLLGVNVTQWGQGIEQLAKLAWSWGLQPHVNRVLAALAVKLLQPGEAFRVDPTAILRGDSEGVAKLVAALVGDAQRGPVATLEELRHLVGLPPEPEGEFTEPRATGEEDGEGGGSEGGEGGEDGGEDGQRMAPFPLAAALREVRDGGDEELFRRRGGFFRALGAPAVPNGSGDE